MTQESRQHSSLQERQPWIERDLMKLMPETQSQRFEGNSLVARIVISETGEHFLEDGLHRIPVILAKSSNNDVSHRSHNHQLNKLENGMAISVLEYSYIVRMKDGMFQFFICVNNWEHVTFHLPGNSNQLTNINSVETVKSRLQSCIMNVIQDKDSASQFLLSQFPGDSQSLSDLVKIANQTITCSQSQQKCRSLDISCHQYRPADSSDSLSRNIILTAASSNYMEICDAKTTVASVLLTSNEVLPAHDSICIQDSGNRITNIWQSNQELHLSERSNSADLPQDNSLKDQYVSELQQQDNKSFIDSVAEQSISATQLLEMMVQETHQNYGLEKCGEKLICPGTFEEKQPPDTMKSAMFSNGKACELMTPTFQDLFVPSDQRRSLALIQGWCLSDDSSRDSSSSSQAYLLSASRNSYSSFGNLPLQPTIKDYKKNNQALSKIIPVHDHLSLGIMKENCLESSEKIVNDKLFSDNLSHKLVKENCFMNSATNTSEKYISAHLSHEFVKKNCLVNSEINISDKLVFDTSLHGLVKDNCLLSEKNVSDKLSQSCDKSSAENERSKNSSGSLFSDTEYESSSLAGNLELCIKSNESRILLQEKNSSFPCCPESNESNICRQSCDTVMNPCCNVTSDQLKFSKNDITHMNTVDCLVDGALNIKCEQPHLKNYEKQLNKCVDSVTKSYQRNHRDTDQTSSNNDFTLDSQTGSSPTILEAKQQNAEMSSVIDLSSTDDIYMIAGHDIDSFCENLVSSTDSEITSPFHPCQMSTQMEPHAPETSRVANFEFLSANEMTNENVAIHGNNQDFTNSIFIKSSNSTSSPEMISAAISEQQGQISCTKGQEMFGLNSVNMQSSVNEQSRDYTSGDCSLINSDTAQLHCIPLSMPQKPLTTNGDLKITLQNIAMTINKGIHLKAHCELPNQESSLEKIPATLEMSKKGKECHLSFVDSTGNGRSAYPSNSCITSNREIPFPSCAREPLLKEVRILVTDIMKRKRSLFSNGEINSSNISDGSDHQTFTKQQKNQLTTYDTDQKVPDRKNQRRSLKRRSYCQSQKSGQSMVHIPKKHFSISVTEVGQHDQSVQEIKRLSEQSPGCRVRSKGKIDTEQFTKINEKCSLKIQNIHTTGQQICSRAEKGKRMQAGRTLRQSRSLVTNNTPKLPSSEYYEQNEASTFSASKSHDKAHVSPCVSSLFSLTACYSTSDWRNVTPVLTSSSEHENQENLLGQSKLLPTSFNCSPSFDSQGFVPLARDDDRNDQMSTSAAFEIDSTEATLTNSETLHATAKLDQSIASIANYIHHGKFL